MNFIVTWYNTIVWKLYLCCTYIAYRHTTNIIRTTRADNHLYYDHLYYGPLVATPSTVFVWIFSQWIQLSHTWKNEKIHSHDDIHVALLYCLFWTEVDTVSYQCNQINSRIHTAQVDIKKRNSTSLTLFAYYAKPPMPFLPQHSQQVGKTSLQVLKVRLQLS